MRYAMVKDGFVINIIKWDGVSPYTPPEGTTLVPATNDATIGGTWDGNVFGPAPEPEPQP